MKRVWLLFAVTMIAALLLAGAPRCFAEDLPYLAPYAGHVGFLPGSPAVAGNALSGFINPAAFRMLPGGEAEFFWSEPEPQTGVPRSWSLVLGGRALSFGVTHWKWDRDQLGCVLGPGYVGTIPPEQSMTDYTVALSTGDGRVASGIAFQWSSGDTWERRNDKAISLGSIWRPAKQLSLGAATAFTFHDGEQRYVLDAGVRPFGSSILTVFGDLTHLDHHDSEDPEWSAGIASEFLPGISVFGRTRKDDSYTWGISVSLGTFGVSTSPDHNEDGDLLRTTYGVRIGYREPTLGSAMTKGTSYLSLDMKGRTRYRRYRWFDNGGHTLTELIRDLEEVRTDDRYAGVAMNLSSMSMSMALRWEVREKLQEVRDAGKKVVIFFDYADIGMYHLASVADRIVIDPEGGVMLLGLGMSRTYMKKMLEKMGLASEEWRFFKYKSAAEVLTREEMSEADREQRQALMDGFYDEIRKDVSASRGFSPAHFDSFVNNMMFALADTAKALGLVDELGRWPEIKDVIEDLEGEKKGMVGKGGMTLFRTREDTWSRPPQVAVIYALGPCAMDEGIAARRLGAVIRRAGGNKDIKAIVFRADSPGGEIIASDIVAEELKKAKKEKPVIVTQGWVAGSGGYWISMYSDRILATPFTITGSIGVIGFWIWNDGIGDKLGLSSGKVATGDHADIFLGIRLPLIGAMIPDRNLTRGEFQRVEHEIRLSYEHFLAKVAEGRNMTRDEVHRIGEGRVWTGRDGLRIGLVDEIGGLDRAIAIAKKEAGIPEDQEIEMVELPRMGFLNPNMFKMPSPFGRLEESVEIDYLKAMIRNNGRPLALIPPDLVVEP